MTELPLSAERVVDSDKGSIDWTKRPVQQDCLSLVTDLLLSLDLDANLQPDGAGHGRLVGALLEVVPHVHLARERAHLDDGLAEEVVALPRQLLPQLRLEVVVLVPDADLDPVRRVVALAATQMT